MGRVGWPPTLVTPSPRSSPAEGSQQGCLAHVALEHVTIVHRLSCPSGWKPLQNHPVFSVVCTEEHVWWFLCIDIKINARKASAAHIYTMPASTGFLRWFLGWPHVWLCCVARQCCQADRPWNLQCARVLISVSSKWAGFRQIASSDVLFS